MVQRLRVYSFAVSLDGCGAGPQQSIDNPLGLGGPRLHDWIFETKFGRSMIGEAGGSQGYDNEFLERGVEGIGATIMGRNMFGPIRGDWPNGEWRGWWGDDPS